VGIRRKARTIALQALFEVDSVAHDAGETLDRLLEEASLPEGGALFARELVGGVLKNRERIDTMIQSYAPAWPVAQLAAIDKLAKTFGSENSPKFINGVLGTVSAQASR